VIVPRIEQRIPSQFTCTDCKTVRLPFRPALAHSQAVLALCPRVHCAFRQLHQSRHPSTFLTSLELCLLNFAFQLLPVALDLVPIHDLFSDGRVRAPLFPHAGAFRLQTPYLNGLAGRKGAFGARGEIWKRLTTLGSRNGKLSKVASAAWPATNHVDSARATVTLQTVRVRSAATAAAILANGMSFAPTVLMGLESTG
jgi:hypothetical protein